MKRILDSSEFASSQSKLYEFTNGIDLDIHIALQEIKVQKAWAKAIAEIKVINKEELNELLNTYDKAQILIQSKKFDWHIEDEDIHMNLERFLTEELGEIGKRVHLGRSRNDLIATTLRLFVSDSLLKISNYCANVICAITDQSEKWHTTIIPGMTHLQSGQPIRMSSAFSSHAWAFLRDIERILIVRSRALEVMPLGSAAMAGTTLPVDLGGLAQDLGFHFAPFNSYDSVGDRDFMIEALNGFALIGVHLSRFSEDCIFWTSTPVGLLKLSPEWSTGSSIMPNKRNPDIPELMRAKSSHFISAAQQAHLLMKGLPTSYNSDLHELKRIFLSACNELETCLKILVPFIQGLQINSDRAQELLSQGYVLATDIANFLTLQGMSFRESYQKVANMIAQASAMNLSIEEYIRIIQSNPILQKNLEKISFEGSVESRNSSGGTSSCQVKRSIDELHRRLRELLPDSVSYE